jgi:translation elongation factor EF-G
LLQCVVCSNHSAEPRRAAEKEAQMDKVYELLDSYFDEEDSDLEKLYTALQSELIENGFLSKMFREEQAKAKTVKAVKKAES